MKFFVKLLMALSVCSTMWFTGQLRAQDEPIPTPPSPPPPQDSALAAPAPGSAPVPDSNSGTGPVQDNEVTFQTFYDTLGTMGNWIQSDQYGYIWQPLVNDPNWAPYTAGHWVYSDDGWTWVSDEPWGWATYHYGRWVNLTGTGWCWVPGYTWAPAWVSWRYNDDTVGWAPLPPDSFAGIDYASEDYDYNADFHIGGDCDAYYGIGAGYYQFLPIIYLGYPHYRDYYIQRHRNFDLINRTTNVTNINVIRHGNVANAQAFQGRTFNRVTVGGPFLAQVNALAQTPVQKVNLVRSNQPGGGTVTNQSLTLFAPRFTAAASPGLKPATVAGTIQHPSINHGTDIASPLIVNQRLLPTPATADEIKVARAAQLNAPERAKILTSENQAKPILAAPLFSLKPVAPPHAQMMNPSFSPSTYPHNAPVAPNGSPYQPHQTYSPQVAPQPSPYTPHQTYSPQVAPAPQHSPYVPHPSYSPQATPQPTPGGSFVAPPHSSLSPPTYPPGSAQPSSSPNGGTTSHSAGGSSGGGSGTGQNRNH